MEKKKIITVLGAGESGVGAAILAKKQGFDVFVSDSAWVRKKYGITLDVEKIKWEHGAHFIPKILESDLIIKSPGIPDSAPVIKAIKENNIPIISEIEFASEYTNAFIVAITGSNGKTTTTSMIYSIFKEAGKNVGVAGNIGKSFARQVAEKDFDIYVLEISSFQLDDIVNFKPNIAILMNLSPDHLDRYDYKYENYIKAKFNIIKNQTEDDLFIYSHDDKDILNHIKKIKIKAKTISFSIKEKLMEGAYIENEILKIIINKKELDMPVYKLGLVGQHNVYNSMAAAIVGKAVDLKKTQIRESLQNFKNLEHRMEKVLKIGGVQYINDSKATNVNSTWYALESVQAPLIWIVGGVDKGNDYAVLETLVSEKVHTIICLGKDNRNIHKSFAKHTDLLINAQSMVEAVKIANQFSDKGDTVLLSPACASFDMFENYEDRGNQFKNAVKNL